MDKSLDASKNERRVALGKISRGNPPLICTTLFAEGKRDFLASAKSAAEKGSNLVELRIDHLHRPTLSTISEIIAESPLPVIATNRSERNGGLAPNALEGERLSLLESIVKYSPEFVDYEFEIPEDGRNKLFRAASQAGVRVICSYHDFKATPTEAEILGLFHQIEALDPDVAKLVFTPRNADDVLSILQAAEKMCESKTPFTVFGMGQRGQITRLLSPVFGSSLVYCSLQDRSSNSLGQIGVGFAKEYFERLGQEKTWRKLRSDPSKLMNALKKGLATEEEIATTFDPLSALEQA